MREVDGMDRDSYAVWDRRIGVVAEITRLSHCRWAVEDYSDGVVSYFRTRRQAIHYAMLLPIAACGD